MNSKITALVLTAATALSLAPKTASAGNRELALVGGFIGGLIVASAINDSHHDTCTAPVTTVVVDRCNEGYDNCRTEPCETGYWKSVDVRVWVPGCWVSDRRYRGRDCRYYVEGHYECHTDRVWVSNVRYERHEGHEGHERRGRAEVGYGYGRGR